MGERVVVGDLELARDVGAGAWVVETTVGAWFTVGSLLPACFSAYAEVFHPAYVLVPDRDQAGDDALGIRRMDGSMAYEKEVPWEEVALANGRVAHPEMDWGTITGDECFRYGQGTQPEVWDHAPHCGSLPVRQRRELAQTLAGHTDTPDHCWFAVWEGFGGLPFSTHGLAKVQMPNRPMVLFSGPLHAATRRLSLRPGIRAQACGGRRTAPGASPRTSISWPRTLAAAKNVSPPSSATRRLRHSGSHSSWQPPGTRTPSIRHRHPETHSRLPERGA